MPRLVPAGTPSRTDRYLFPRRKFAPFAASLAAALILAGFLILGAFSGSRIVGSPAPLATVHANFEKACASCHGPRVVDVRCEHCHDPSGTGRYENGGHVWFATKDPVAIRKAAFLDCARCHTDHRGRNFNLSPVDDRQCRSCHFAAFSKHPEFALVKAGIAKDEGLQFSHARHLKAVAKAKLDECQSCHEPTRDRRSFQPVNFDQHCGRCHLPGGFVGGTEPLPVGFVVLPQEIDAPWAKTHARPETDARGRTIVPKLPHKDPWVLFNLRKIAREVDPEGAAARRAQLSRRIADLNSQLGMQRFSFSREVLQQEERKLSKDAAALAAQPPHSPDRVRAERALARVQVQLELGPAPMAAIRTRARSQLERNLRQLQGDLADLTSGSPTPGPVSDEKKQAGLGAMTALTAPCALCHVYDGPWMQPVQAGVSMLTRANFNHLPHLQQMACQACHRKVAQSKKAEDVNLPSVQSCQACHRPGRSRAECAECHTYHPQNDPWPPI